MKKWLICLLLLAVASLAFADDALVLPKGVLRTYFTGAYAFASSGWDADGNKEDFSTSPGYFDGYSAFNVGGAVEFGVTDWLSAAVQWAPGWNVWSSFDNPGSISFAPLPISDIVLDENTSVNGPYDIFAGAKIQVVGEQGLVPMDIIRVAFAPGVKIPLPRTDWAEQDDNKTAGDSWALQPVDKHCWGAGARAYFDYILNDMIYFNLYAEFIYYLTPEKFEEGNYVNWYLDGFGVSLYSELEYGFDLTLEAEPHFETMISDGVRLGLGVPVTFSMTPELKYDDTAQADTDSYLLTVAPNASLFLMKFPVPIEFKVGYTLPLLGKNADATNIVVLQIKSYLKFY